MSADLDTRAAHLRALRIIQENADARAKADRDLRDTVRQAAAAGIPIVDIAAAAGVTRRTIYAEGLTAGTLTEADYCETSDWIADEQPAGCWEAFDHAYQVTLAKVAPMPTAAAYYSAH